MDTDAKIQKKRIHHGQNVKCLRGIWCIKQETLAEAINYSQQSISRLEMQQKIDGELLGKIAKKIWIFL